MAEIPLNAGRVALVDDDDLPLVSEHRWSAYPHHRGGHLYAMTSVYRPHRRFTKMTMHRLILGLPTGSVGQVQVDHINGDGLDNRRCNLRLATPSQNQHNKRRKTSGSSRFKGVCWNSRVGKWQATIGRERGTSYLGLFENEEDAARAYDAAAVERFGEFARCNFTTQECAS